MIAATVAHFFRDLSRLGAFVFFNRDSPSKRNPTMLFRTIAAQLSAFNQVIAEGVAAAVHETPSIGQSPLAMQFSELLLKPLLLLQESLQFEGPFVIVIDALDECETGPSRDAVLSILAEQSSKLPSFVRIVITSSPARDICDTFKCRNVTWGKVNDADSWSEV